MKRQTLLLTALTITAMMLPAQNKTALVIGNGEYENNFAALANPVPEARRMAASPGKHRFSRSIRAYNVQNQERFDALFAMFEEEIKARGGIALFHYGGHGVQVDGQNYLLPTERDIPDERRARTRGINLADVVAAMESARADANIVILDACRENPFGRGAGPRSGPCGCASQQHRRLCGGCRRNGPGRPVSLPPCSSTSPVRG